ncbi:hypothetical protein VN97_g1569 [Penicillium thymicola]|uniref:Uncharacterized protein n=1 Tax=Penicillium thymicola TaxID=293382 RepID=A0AAI9TQN3_PENTH|nr:hypothetical protein VN97_g1569 [Penicillium thymicola]
MEPREVDRKEKRKKKKKERAMRSYLFSEAFFYARAHLASVKLLLFRVDFISQYIYPPPKNAKCKKEEVVPGIEPGLLVSETRVMTITLHNRNS